MRLGLARKKRCVTKVLAMLLTGSTLLAAAGCSTDVAGIFVDALGSALDSAVPALMDLLKSNMTDNSGGGSTTTPTGGGNGFLPVVMLETPQPADSMLA